MTALQKILELLPHLDLKLDLTESVSPASVSVSDYEYKPLRETPTVANINEPSEPNIILPGYSMKQKEII